MKDTFCSGHVFCLPESAASFNAIKNPQMPDKVGIHIDTVLLTAHSSCRRFSVGFTVTNTNCPHFYSISMESWAATTDADSVCHSRRNKNVLKAASFMKRTWNCYLPVHETVTVLREKKQQLHL